MSSDRQTISPSHAIRARVRQHLPKYIRKILADYASCAELAPNHDVKSFQSHQAACKAALQHLDSALKILAWAENGAPELETPAPGETERLIDLAKRTLADINMTEDDGEAPAEPT